MTSEASSEKTMDLKGNKVTPAQKDDGAANNTRSFSDTPLIASEGDVAHALLGDGPGSHQSMPTQTMRSPGKTGKSAAALKLIATGLRTTEGNELSIRPEAVDLVKGVLPVGLNMLFGKPSAGKTAVAISLALHVALGRNWMSRRTLQGPVIYIATESEVGIQRRIFRLLIELGLPPVLPPNFLIVGGAFHISNGPMLEALAEAIDQQGVGDGLVIIDTLANATTGIDENSSGELNRQLMRLRQLVEEWGRTVLVLHHSTKASESHSSKAPTERGTGAIKGAVEASFWCRFIKKSQFIELHSDKQKDGSTGFIGAFRLAVATIGRNRLGEDIPVPAAVFDSQVTAAQSGQQRVVGGQSAGSIKPETKGQTRFANFIGGMKRLNGAVGDVDIDSLREVFCEDMEAETGLSTDPVKREQVKRKAFQTAMKSAITQGMVIKKGNAMTLNPVGKREEEVSSPMIPTSPAPSNQKGKAGKESLPSLEGRPSRLPRSFQYMRACDDFGLGTVKSVNSLPA